jgi:hypothetical protein
MNFNMLERADVHDDLRRLARTCEALAGGRKMARWREFRPVQVRWMIGRLFVIEVLDGGVDYFFRLGGTVLDEIYGTDLNQKRLSEAENGPLRAALRTGYDTVVASGEPLFGRAVLHWQKGQDIHIQRLLIPFAGDEERVQMILGGVYSDVPAEMLVLYRDKAPVEFRHDA